LTVTEPNEAVQTTEAKQEDTGTHFGRWLIETAVMIALAFLLAQGIKTFVIQPFVIPTGSMEPTIMTGDRVLAEKVSLRFRDVRTGEIVVFDDPTGRHPQLIKRVIAVGGQTVDIQDGSVVVNGAPLDEAYVHGKVTDPGTVPLPITLADDQVWLMGDNRPNSGDSRFMGPIDESMVRGRAFSIYWPIDRISALR
jgi:signal peptidase I